MSRSITALCIVALASSCGEPASHVASGTYLCDMARDAAGETVTPTPVLTLEVDVSTSKATLTDANGVATALTLTLAPESEWLQDCFTNTSHATSDVHNVKPDPLVVGNLTFAAPILSRKCGGKHLIAPRATGSTTQFLSFDVKKNL